MNEPADFDLEHGIARISALSLSDILIRKAMESSPTFVRFISADFRSYHQVNV